MCALPGTFIPRLPLFPLHTIESRRVLSLPHGEKHLGKFGERQNSELSTFLFLFFFLRNFFPPTADDFTILGGGGWRFWLLLPLHSKCRTKPYIPQEARASEFPKDEVAWRLLPSQLQLPLPPVSSPQPGQGGPARLGGDPKRILPLAVMLQKLKTHL